MGNIVMGFTQLALKCINTVVHMKRALFFIFGSFALSTFTEECQNPYKKFKYVEVVES